MMQDKRKLIQDMPGEIIALEVKAHYSIPVYYKHLQETKEKFPEYWNELDEFDPHFKKRNRFINFFRAFYLHWVGWRRAKAWTKSMNESTEKLRKINWPGWAAKK